MHSGKNEDSKNLEPLIKKKKRLILFYLFSLIPEAELLFCLLQNANGTEGEGITVTTVRHFPWNLSQSIKQ